MSEPSTEQSTTLNRALIELWKIYKGLNDKQAADELGIKQASYSRYMKGQALPDMTRQSRIVEAMQVHPGLLIRRHGKFLEGTPSEDSYPWVVETKKKLHLDQAEDWEIHVLAERDKDPRRYRSR